MTAQGALAAVTEQALASVVSELVTRFGGGTAFFDALDEHMREKFWYRSLLLRYIDLYGEVDSRPRLVVSGEFGRGFASWLFGSEWSHYVPLPPLVLPGNLRHSVLGPLSVSLAGDKFVFLDDSTYKGRTYGQIRDRIEEAGGIVLGGIVLYDGSQGEPQFPSFFRWHKP